MPLLKSMPGRDHRQPALDQRLARLKEDKRKAERYGQQVGQYPERVAESVAHITELGVKSSVNLGREPYEQADERGEDDPE